MSRIVKLEKYRGLPIPFVVYRDADNIPHFKINDENKVKACIESDLCSVCGEKLSGDSWLIGGPKSAFHPNGAYIDVPVHKECGVFSLQNCPYMAYTKYSAKTPLGLLGYEVDGMKLYNPTLDQNRLEYFVFIKISSYTVKVVSHYERFIYPKRPYLEIEYWKDGCEISKKDAEAL